MSRKSSDIRIPSGEPNPAAPDTGEAAPADGALLGRIGEGDREAFAIFYDRHAPAVFGFVRRLMGQAREADDVLQETFWQVWRQAERYSPDRGGPRTWLLLIARSRAIDQLRRLRSRGKVETPMTARAREAAKETEPDDDDGVAPPEGAIEAALDTLPDEQRQAIEQAFFGGLTHKEVAERLGDPLGTVKTRIRLGMGKLRESLQRAERRGKGRGSGAS